MKRISATQTHVQEHNEHMEVRVQLLSSHLVVPEQQGVEGVGQVEGQRGGQGDGAGVHQSVGGWRNRLAELPQKDFRAGQQQSGEPHQQQLKEK